MVDLVSFAFPDFKLEWLVKETKRNLPCELNFTMEGKNAEKTAKLMEHLPWLHVNYTFTFNRLEILTHDGCALFFSGTKSLLGFFLDAGVDYGIL